MRQRLVAASGVGAVLCAVLAVWAWTMTTGDPYGRICTPQKLCAYSPHAPTHQTHPFRAEMLLVLALVLVFAAVVASRPRRPVARQGATDIPVG
jgi:hypothetical protein